MLPTITCKEFDCYREGWGFILTSLIKDLVGKNAADSRCLRIMRGDTLVWNEVPLSVWVNPPKGEVPKQFLKEKK